MLPATRDSLAAGGARIDALLLICAGPACQGAGSSCDGWTCGEGGGACGWLGSWSWCARAPGLISVRDPAVQPVGDVMVDGVFPLG